MIGHEPPEPVPPTATTSGQPPADATVAGETRAEWYAELRAEKGDAWMEAHEGFLNKEWVYMVQTFGD